MDPSPESTPEPPPPAPRGKSSELHPQLMVSKFWQNYHSKTQGKVTRIFPRRLYKDLATPLGPPRHDVRNATQSYEAARSECMAMIHKAVAHCERTNSKFTDPEFDIEADFMWGQNNCLSGLERDESWPEEYSPGSVHRLPWIFENPRFTVDGFSSSDIKQGAIGDCWWVAAVGNIAHRTDLMDKICVGRDEECGIYGFVFYRDGEWFPTIIDDNLYLREVDFGSYVDIYDSRGKKAKLYKKQKQTGSEALYFSQCGEENETWLPLLEKAYAKVHGDYDAINGGWLGSAVDSLTGGVTTIIIASSVLRKDRLWREMLTVDKKDGEFVFGVSANSTFMSENKNGIPLGHAYSVLKAVQFDDEDGKKIRLVKIRNPWGERSFDGLGEWHGPWSDGSKEWTPAMIEKLGHEFADDGVFWMSFDDVLSNFEVLDRTRLFDEKWTVAQQWTSSPISWVPGYLKNKFVIEVTKAGETVIVLSTLNPRFFKGLEGQYDFDIEFLLRKSDSTETLAEVRGTSYSDTKTANCEIWLEPGTYEVLPKITAERSSRKAAEKVIQIHADKNPKKLRQIGMKYDLAHAKVGVLDEDAELERKREKEKNKKKREQEKEQEKTAENVESDTMARIESAINEIKEQLNKEGKKKEQEKEGDEKGEKKTDEKEEKKTDEKEEKKTDEGGEKKSGEEGEKKTDEKTDEGGEKNIAEEGEKKIDKEGEQPADGNESDSDSESESDSDEESSGSELDFTSIGDDPNPPPWNPVCVLGLRVYAQDKGISTKLVQEEAKDGEKKTKKSKKKKAETPEGEPTTLAMRQKP